MAACADVKVNLVLDSNAEKVTEDFRKDLVHVGDVAKKTHGRIDTSIAGNLGSLKTLAIGGFGMAASAAVAAGAAIVGAVVYSAHAFMESEKQVKALAGSFMLLNETGISFKEMTGYASAMKDELEELGMKVGVTDDELVETFTNIVERGGKSVEAAQKLTESMALAGRAIPGGAAGISQAFEQIEMGVIRAKNPIVGMIAATGMLKGNAKHVAAEMQKMTVAEQMELAEKAISRMGEKMRSTPLGVGQMMTSLKIGVGNIFEGMGEPIMKSIAPLVGIIRDFFMENREDMTATAVQFGEGIGRIVSVGAPILREVFKVMKESSGTFKKAFDEMYGPTKELFGYIYNNKDAFAKTIGDILKMIIMVADKLITAMGAVLKTTRAIIGAVGGPLMELVAPGSAKFAAEEKQAGILGGVRAGVKGGGMTSEAVAKQKAEFIATAKEGGMSEVEAYQQFDVALNRAKDDHNAVMSDVAAATSLSMTGSAAEFAKAFDIAAKSQDVSAQRYVIDFLGGNEGMADAIAKAGPDIFKTGLEGFYSALEAAGGATFAADLKKKMMAARMGETGKTSVTQNFTGAINIKQDFRDQDPDRIIVAFKNQLASAGSSRIQARTATPGGF